MCLQIIYLICMYKEDLALNNRQRLICHKKKPNITKHFTQYLEQIHGYVHAKIQACSENNLTFGEENYKQIHIPVDIPLEQRKTVWTIDITYFRPFCPEYSEVCGRKKLIKS